MYSTQSYNPYRAEGSHSVCTDNYSTQALTPHIYPANPPDTKGQFRNGRKPTQTRGECTNRHLRQELNPLSFPVFPHSPLPSVSLSVCLSLSVCIVSIYLSVCLSLSLSLSVSIYLSVSISLSLSLSISLSVCIYLSLCLSLSISQSVCLYLSLSVCLYLSLPLSVSLSLSLSPSLSLPLSLSFCLSLSASISLFNCSLLCECSIEMASEKFLSLPFEINTPPAHWTCSVFIISQSHQPPPPPPLVNE